MDFLSKHWTCPFCFSRNVFPPHYAECITETNLPAELIPQFTTLEYQMPGRHGGPPAFVYVVDSCLPEDEMDALKDSITQSLSLLPPSALVGFMTYGTNVSVHELSGADVPKQFVFKGSKEYEPSVVATLLGLHVQGAAQGPNAPALTNKFLLPVAECAYVIERILEDSGKDPWPKAADQRPARATGSALAIAESLLEKTVGRQGARVLLFMGGPPCVGPGSVVGRPLAETLRSHSELQKDAAPLYKAACAFYKGIAARASANGHSIDVFVSALDQLGLLELKSCIVATGGVCVLADSFSQSVFKESFRRMFRRHEDTAPGPEAGHLQMGFAATLECLTSRDYKISGAIGPCVSLKKGSPSVSETEVGEGGTFAWSLGGVDPSTSVALYFDVSAKDAASAQPGRRHHLQLITYYQHSSGRYRMRVTTSGGMWNSGDPSAMGSLAASFDQEAAAVLMARVAVNRTESEDPGDILRWLDRSLIRVCAKFAEYRKDDPASFRLSPNFSLFPQFLFHLRRSQFMQTFNMSPDEGCYNRMIFCREDVSNSLVMVQPALICYSFQSPPQPVLLDATSVRPDVILLLDTFFHVLVFHGETIASWRDQGYADQPEHAAFRALLQAPKDDAAAIMESRFPVPRYIVCDQHKSQARFLMAKLNPSVTHNNAADGSGVAPVFTDDVAYNTCVVGGGSSWLCAPRFAPRVSHPSPPPLPGFRSTSPSWQCLRIERDGGRGEVKGRRGSKFQEKFTTPALSFLHGDLKMPLPADGLHGEPGGPPPGGPPHVRVPH